MERCQIVVCDDQEPFRQLVSMILGLDPDLEVVGEAADGRQAVDLVAKLHPDLLLLDIAMPVMDGLEALPLIRASNPETQVVMLTGVTVGSIRERAMAAGAAGFIEKGADVDDLARRVKDICREPG